MVKRCYAATRRALLRRFPIVTVLGPRQCGKTTFIRQALRGWTYLDLERPSDAAPITADPWPISDGCALASGRVTRLQAMTPARA